MQNTGKTIQIGMLISKLADIWDIKKKRKSIIEIGYGMRYKEGLKYGKTTTF